MKRIKLILGVLTLMFVVSCGNGNNEKEIFDNLKKDVLAVHDEVMPKMGKINTLIGELKKKIDTTEAGKKYETAKKDLEESHKMMMDWMKDFGDHFSGSIAKDSLAKKIQMLKEEGVKVDKLKEKINLSIKNAEAILGDQ